MIASQRKKRSNQSEAIEEQDPMRAMPFRPPKVLDTKDVNERMEGQTSRAKYFESTGYQRRRWMTQANTRGIFHRTFRSKKYGATERIFTSTEAEDSNPIGGASFVTSLYTIVWRVTRPRNEFLFLLIANENDGKKRAEFTRKKTAKMPAFSHS